jgi:hypothetical protein
MLANVMHTARAQQPSTDVAMNRHRRLLCTLLILVPFFAAGAAACSSTNVTSGPSSAKCQVTVGTVGAIVASGATANVPVTAPPECGWDVTTPANWITALAPASGQGSAMLEFQVAPNPAPTPRETDVLINQEKVHVTQEAASCDYTILPNNLTITSAGGPGTINVNTLAGCSWNGVSDVPWITITGTASGSGNGAIRFSAASNGGALRVGTVTIAGQVATINQSAPVTPAPGPDPGPNPGPNPNPNPNPNPGPGPSTPPPCTYTITPTTYAAGPGGGAAPSVSVSAINGCTWTAASNDSWITVTSGAIGNGNGSVAFSVANNPFNVRTGSLTIAGRTLSVQQATACVFTLSRTSLSMPANPKPGVTRSVKVTASGAQCNWTASTPNSWITIVTGANYVGTQDVDISATTNTGAPRTGTLIIEGQTVTVTQ